MRIRTQAGVVMWAVALAVVLVMSWSQMMIATAQEIAPATNTPAVVLEQAPIPDADETEEVIAVGDGDTAPVVMSTYENVIVIVTGILSALVVGLTTIQTLQGRQILNKNNELVPMVLNFARGLAAMTPTTVDDKAVAAISSAFGYEVVHQPDGAILLKPRMPGGG